MITVYCGDPHATVEDLDECHTLCKAVLDFCQKTKAKRVVFLGDQHHAHSVVRLEVMAFWREVFGWFKALDIDVLCLVGNHDLSNDRNTDIMSFYRDVRAIGTSPVLIDGVLYLGYVHDPEEFVKICQRNPSEVVVCHQLFDGSKYENGFYVGEDGIDSTRIPQKLVISGHIHKPQRFGKVWYLGSPRWRIASDANEDRAVWAVNHRQDGSVGGMVAMDTAPYCRRIVHLQDTPEAPASPPAAGPLVDVRVDVTGPTAYVRARAEELEAHGVRVRTFRTDQSSITVKESEGLQVAWKKFRQSFVPSRGTSMDRVAKLAEERFGLAA